MIHGDDVARSRDRLQRGRWFLSRLCHFERLLDESEQRPQNQRLSDQQLARLYRYLKSEYQPTDL